MMNRSLRLPVLTLLIAGFASGAYSQSVGISDNGAAPAVDAMLDINVGSLVTKKGMLIPRMTRAQRLAVAAPADGLLVFQTDNTGGDLSGMWYYDGSLPAWKRFATGDGWKVAGDVGLATYYVGTSDATDFVMATNANPAVFITPGGDIGVGTGVPAEKLEVDGAIHFDVSGATNLTNDAGGIRFETTDQRHQGNIDGTVGGWATMENAFKEVFGDDYEGTTLTCGPGLSAEVGAQNAQSAGNADTPFPTAVGRGSKVQYIFRASELLSYGLCAGPITEVAFRVITDDTQTTAYNIYVRMENKSIATVGFSGLWDVAARTGPVRGQVLGLVASSGWFAITLTNPYNWNGVSDVVLDVSYLRNAAAGLSPPVLLTANTGFMSTRFGYHPGGTSGSAFNDAPLNPATLGTPPSALGQNQTRPVVRFTGEAQGPVPTLAFGDYALYEGGLSVGSAAWAAGVYKGPGVIQAENAVYDGSVQLSDHVFDDYFDGAARIEDDEKMDDYRWTDLDDLKEFIKENRHLPNMPSREEWETQGKASLGDLQSRLWETIEMQALYITELENDLRILEDLAYKDNMTEEELEELIGRIGANEELTDIQKEHIIKEFRDKFNDNQDKASK